LHTNAIPKAVVKNADGSLTLELEAYLTDRIALLVSARERALFGSDIGKFHTQVSLGLKFIIN
jgi:hypothetical protein